MKVTGNKAYVKSDIDLFVNITGVVGKHRNHSYLSHGSNTKEGFGIKTLEDRYMSKFFNDSLNMMREAKEYMLSEANQAQEEGIIEENQGVESVVQEVETPCAPITLPQILLVRLIRRTLSSLYKLRVPRSHIPRNLHTHPATSGYF